MADVVFNEVDKIYPNGVQAVFDLSLDVQDGEFLVLVGPSGCGKTTALRMVAGLEDISDGTVSIGGRVVNELSPKERDIAMVFQNYALYPHLSVAENIAFGLRLRKAPRDVINERVQWAAKLLDLTPYLDRRPKELSGGQLCPRSPEPLARYPGVRHYVGKSIVLGLRSDDLLPPRGHEGLPTITARIELVEALGSHSIVYLRIDARSLRDQIADPDAEV